MGGGRGWRVGEKMVVENEWEMKKEGHREVEREGSTEKKRERK